MAFTYALNTSTIRGQDVPLLDEIAIAAEAGYDSIEPWVKELDDFVAGGGSLADVKKCVEDNGLTVPNLIGFFAWLSADVAERGEALDEFKRNLDLARQIGCTGLACPPKGITDEPGLDLFWAAEKYAELLDIGREFGVRPILEFWGMSQSLGSLGEAVFVVTETGDADACLLADVFHMYKKGSPFSGLEKLSGEAIGMFHINDYPDDPPRDVATDADRVYPGDGVAPLVEIFRTLAQIGYDGALSLELFNKGYYQRDAREVARTGLEKTKAVVEQALAESA